jgi:hypothetical protein
MPYLFAVGEAVRLKGDFMRRLQKTEVYRVVGTLPPLGEFPQYRIRSDEESHDRVATQDKLERFETPRSDEGDRLARTFAANDSDVRTGQDVS